MTSEFTPKFGLDGRVVLVTGAAAASGVPARLPAPDPGPT